MIVAWYSTLTHLPRVQSMIGSLFYMWVDDFVKIYMDKAPCVRYIIRDWSTHWMRLCIFKRSEKIYPQYTLLKHSLLSTSFEIHTKWAIKMEVWDLNLFLFPFHNEFPYVLYQSTNLKVEERRRSIGAFRKLLVSEGAFPTLTPFIGANAKIWHSTQNDIRQWHAKTTLICQIWEKRLPTTIEASHAKFGIFPL